jgi:thiopurine S-methyltransferase
MEADFWHKRWLKGETGFHESEANALLVRHFDRLKLAQNSRVFVPLCGKTRDIAWLLSQGYRVVGAELSQLAIEQLFADLGLKPVITPKGKLQKYQAPGVEIFAGDIFALTEAELGPVDAVYDRAALVALPAAMRNDYAAYVAWITKTAPQLLITFVYDQSVMPGPPFSIDDHEVARVHGMSYTLTPIESVDVTGGLKGICPAQETVWLLR